MLENFSWLQNILPFFETPLGIASFVILYSIWVTLLLPGVWASMLAGSIYGTWIGTIVVFAGAFIGAEISFLLGRTLFRQSIERRLGSSPKFLSVRKAVSREGLKLIILTRLSPAFPFSLLNFVYGLSEVKLIDYSIGLVAILPGTIIFCGLGALAGDIASFHDVLNNNNGDMIGQILRIVGVITTILTILVVTRVAKKAIQDSQSSN